MNTIVHITDSFIEDHTIFPELIAMVKDFFMEAKVIVPPRHHHTFPNPGIPSETTLLIMPAWQPGKNAGVKVISVNPENHLFKLPSVQGLYIYFSATNGNLKAVIDAKALTAKRTAASSALASLYLSRADSNSMLMVGTGTLSINLIKAHAAIRPLKKIYVWGRDFKKAQKIAEAFGSEKFSIIPVRTIQEQIGSVDIISCATFSKVPLIMGANLRAGQHIDLVGAFRADMRESDDQTIKKASIYVDTYESGVQDNGDICIPLQNGTLKMEDIKGDLFALVSGKGKGRKAPQEITLFKSVGHALEDLAAATYYYKIYTDEENLSTH